MGQQPPSRPRRSKARMAASTLLTPQVILDPKFPNRNDWIKETYEGFAQRNQSNKVYYRVILETLWPANHGIPGPLVSESELRAAINLYRKTNRFGRNPDNDYVDVFRRMRELMGEEALVGILKSGTTYQLANLTIGEKRVPRTALSDENWETVLQRYNYRCANCKRTEPEVRLQQDHKVPRVRADMTTRLTGGVDALDNWQPLCDECNNFKSTSCRNCRLDCFECPWAFPETFKALQISPRNTARLLAYAQAIGVDPDELINSIIEEYVENAK